MTYCRKPLKMLIFCDCLMTSQDLYLNIRTDYKQAARDLFFEAVRSANWIMTDKREGYISAYVIRGGMHTWRCGSNMPLWKGERSVRTGGEKHMSFLWLFSKIRAKKWGGSVRAYSSLYPLSTCVATLSRWTPMPRNVSSIRSNSAPRWVSFLLRFDSLVTIEAFYWWY